MYYSGCGRNKWDMAEMRHAFKMPAENLKEETA
jgi:hypothetical protein